MFHVERFSITLQENKKTKKVILKKYSCKFFCLIVDFVVILTNNVVKLNSRGGGEQKLLDLKQMFC